MLPFSFWSIKNKVWSQNHIKSMRLKVIYTNTVLQTFDICFISNIFAKPNKFAPEILFRGLFFLISTW